MKITSVSYSRLHTLHGYNNERVSASADVEENEAPEDALTELKDWVLKELDMREASNDLRDEVDNLNYRRGQLARETEEYQEKIAYLKSILEAHGVHAKDLEEFPF